jgi:D-alanyl-D-alanine carboxypeptidase
MQRIKELIFICVLAGLVAPSGFVLAEDSPRPVVTAQSYAVVDVDTGKLILASNENLPWPPASMTKLLAAATLLSTNPKLSKTATITKEDEVGGSRLATKVGRSTYTCKDLLYASLVLSANNATNTLVKCSGLSKEEFVAKMNDTARLAGAYRSYFVEPSGISEVNTTTSEDFAYIARFAFKNPLLRTITTTKTYTFSSVGKNPVKHTITNGNRLLSDPTVTVQGGKTGFIYESKNNLTTQLTSPVGKPIVVVVMGSKNKASEVKDLKTLAFWRWQQLAFALNH